MRSYEEQFKSFKRASSLPLSVRVERGSTQPLYLAFCSSRPLPPHNSHSTRRASFRCTQFVWRHRELSLSRVHTLHACTSFKLTSSRDTQRFDQLGPRWEQRQPAKMHLSSHLSCTSRSVATEKALNGSSAESRPVRCTTRITFPRRPANVSIKRQALLPSSSLISRKSGAGVTAVQSSFHGLSLGKSIQLSNGSRWNATWLDNTATVEADVPISVAWDLWSNREGIPQWMPWIDTVKILEDQPDLSKWTLKYSAFGQNWEFSWLSRNMKPTYHQKIHWRSVDGLPNRGTVRFYPRGSTGCAVQLTISYEVPGVLSGLGGAVAPIVENILQQDLNRFAKFAKGQQLESQRK